MKQKFALSLLAASVLASAALFSTATVSAVTAQSPTPAIDQGTLRNAPIETNIAPVESLVATEAGIATDSGSTATPSGEVEKKIQEKQESDITSPTGKQQSKLAAYVEQNAPGSLSWNNFLQHAVRYAVNQGVQANIIVLILLFPLIASLIAASRHIIGLRGFGIYIPAVLAVALVSTGVVEGVLIFLAIIGTAMLTKRMLKSTRLPYLPRTAMVLWTISLGILSLMLIAPAFDLVTLMSVNIFPVLILVLLAENFLDAQGRTKPSDALALTLETLGLAVVAGFFLKWEPLQKFALVEPELLIIGTGLLNILIGKFVGLRVSERLRFRSLIEE